MGGTLDGQKTNTHQCNDAGHSADLGAPTHRRNQASLSLSDSEALQKLMYRITSLEAENQNLKLVNESKQGISICILLRPTQGYRQWRI